MRTDSVNLSDAAIGAISNEITTEFGENYLKVRRFKTNSKGAQEAHEAIRPAYINKATITGNVNEKKLYELIWKRTIASQMSDAELEKTTILIDIEGSKHQFVAQGEMIKFDGFLKVYMESTDDEEEDSGKNLLPIIQSGQKLDYQTITATQKYTLNPPRYTEASLVRKLEELGIGRPSTYAPTISTIQNRGYVVKEDRTGKERVFQQITLKENKITKLEKTEIFGNEKSKLFPTDIGMVVNDYLLEHFPNIMDLNFTAEVEKQFDDIAEGEMVWYQMIDEFYRPFHERIDGALEIVGRKSGERQLGTDPKTGKPIIVKIGRYGPMAQIGDNEDTEKPQYAALRRDQHIETITIEEALELFKLPRDLGMFEDKKVDTSIGRFGPYVRHNNKFYSLKKGVDDPYTVELARAIELIEEKRITDQNKSIAVFPGPDGEIQLLNGRFGAYIAYNKQNYRIPKDKIAKELTLEQCLEIIKNTSVKPARKKGK
jgi:DNA topoisomerase-1